MHITQLQFVFVNHLRSLISFGYLLKCGHFLLRLWMWRFDEWNYQSPLFAFTCFVFIISISFSAFSVFCITSAAWKVKREVRKHDQTESQQINCTFIFFRGAETEHCCNSKFLTDLPWFQCECRKAREFVRAHSCSLHYFLLDFSDRPLVEIVSTHRSNERKNKIKLMLKWSLHFCITTTVWWLRLT